MNNRKCSLRILFAMIAIAALALAMLVKQKRVAYSLSSSSPDGNYTCATIATTLGSPIAWKLKVDTSITRNSDGLLCHRQIDFYKNLNPADPDKVPMWSEDGKTVTHWFTNSGTKMIHFDPMSADVKGMLPTKCKLNGDELLEKALAELEGNDFKYVFLFRASNEWFVHYSLHQNPNGLYIPGTDNNHLILDDDGNPR